MSSHQPGGHPEELNPVTQARKRPWVPNKPEQRFSIAFNRFLERALKRPCKAYAIRDADGAKRTMQAILRDKNRGVPKGLLDWDVTQGPDGLNRKVELKRDKNDTTPTQDQTIKDLTACGAPPVVAWTLREAYEGMAAEGFRFERNVETVLAHCEALLEGWDREAEAILSGAVVKKRAAPRKPGPRFTWKAHA